MLLCRWSTWETVVELILILSLEELQNAWMDKANELNPPASPIESRSIDCGA